MNIFKPKRKGNNIIISAPSGVGKSTIIANLLEDFQLSLQYSISATTRVPRKGEKDGIHYHFVSQADFYNLVDNNAFIEYAEVYGNFYGTLLSDVEAKLNQGINVLFDIDWQGATALKEKMPNDTISIFILPPSVEELERRLRSRAKDKEEVIKYRMTQAKYEISHCYQYDHIIVNDSLNIAIEEIKKIIFASKLKTNRISNIKDFTKTTFN